MSTDTATTLPREAETLPFRYNAALAGEIERRWQDRWEPEGTFHAPNPAGPLAPADDARAGDKLYLLDMFPYPSGAGLHVGHPLGYIGTDVLGRYLRMTGRNVLHTMGFDAFGLPAEQYAVQTGTHPRTTTEENIAAVPRAAAAAGPGARPAPLGRHHRRRVLPLDPVDLPAALRLLVRRDAAGPGRSRELEEEFAAGSRPDAGRPSVGRADRRRAAPRARLATGWPTSPRRRSTGAPGWARCWRTRRSPPTGAATGGNFPVFRRNLRQWMMRITAYADRLVADLDRLDWPDSVKAMQRNWIGRSDGRAGPVPASATRRPIEVFTTRPDTLFGATYMVLAPEHPLVDAIATRRVAGGRRPAVDRRRRHPGRGGRGVPRGGGRASPTWTARRTRTRPASSPAPTRSTRSTAAAIPVFVADYVLMGYGTGAIMAVPGQDQRDWDFATAFGLPIIRTVRAVRRASRARRTPARARRSTPRTPRSA